MSAERQAIVDSWKVKLPSFEIKRWTRADLPSNSAFVDYWSEQDHPWALTDYASLYALHSEGGIYLDTDVAMVKSLEPLCQNSAFIGFQEERQSRDWLGTAVVGAEAGCPFLRRCLDELDASICLSSFRLDGSKVLTEALTRMGLSTYERQCIDGIELYTTGYFYPRSFATPANETEYSDSTYCDHKWFAGWRERELRKPSKTIELSNACEACHCLIIGTDDEFSQASYQESFGKFLPTWSCSVWQPPDIQGNRNRLALLYDLLKVSLGGAKKLAEKSPRWQPFVSRVEKCDCCCVEDFGTLNHSLWSLTAIELCRFFGKPVALLQASLPETKDQELYNKIMSFMQARARRTSTIHCNVELVPSIVTVNAAKEVRESQGLLLDPVCTLGTKDSKLRVIFILNAEKNSIQTLADRYACFWQGTSDLYDFEVSFLNVPTVDDVAYKEFFSSFPIRLRSVGNDSSLLKSMIASADIVVSDHRFPLLYAASWGIPGLGIMEKHALNLPAWRQRNYAIGLVIAEQFTERYLRSELERLRVASFDHRARLHHQVTEASREIESLFHRFSIRQQTR